jgi:hypothetical protein
MFPEAFAAHHISKFTIPGEFVLDPFSGRGTTAFQALLMERSAAASDVNPVSYCISRAKTQAPSLNVAIERISELRALWEQASHNMLARERRELPDFFGRAFYWTTLEQILWLRDALRWKTHAVDCFIAALCLGSLHGDRDKSPYYFSNQMPRTISPKPGYSLRFWRERDLWPHKRDVLAILEQRAHFRLKHGKPDDQGIVSRCDVRQAAGAFEGVTGRVRLVCTSPPYFNVTNYEEDQWLRLWFLGGPPHPTYKRISTDDRHLRKEEYWSFLCEAWQGIEPLLRDDAIIVCRMSGKGMSAQELHRGVLESVRSAFPKAGLAYAPERSELKGRQTHTFRPGSEGCKYEWDFTIRINED